MSDSVRPHRRQPTRLPRPWDSPGKNTGVGCHFLLQCMKVKSESAVAQSYLTLSEPADCSLPGSSVHRFFQARILEWVDYPFSSRSPLDLGIEKGSPPLRVDFLPTELSGKPLLLLLSHFSHVQLCVTPQTAGPPGSVIPGILQARTLEWVAISFCNA